MGTAKRIQRFFLAFGLILRHLANNRSRKDYDQARAPLKFPTLPLSKWQLKSCPTQKKHFVTSPSSSERSKLFPQEACVNLAPRFPHMRRGTEPNTTYDYIFAHRCKWRSRGRIWHHLMSAAVAIFYLPNPYPNPTSTKMSRFSHNSWSSFFSGVVGQVTCHMKMCAGGLHLHSIPRSRNQEVSGDERGWCDDGNLCASDMSPKQVFFRENKAKYTPNKTPNRRCNWSLL